jgi:hypothetical protein
LSRPSSPGSGQELGVGLGDHPRGLINMDWPKASKPWQPDTSQSRINEGIPKSLAHVGQGLVWICPSRQCKSQEEKRLFISNEWLAWLPMRGEDDPFLGPAASDSVFVLACLPDDWSSRPIVPREPVFKWREVVWRRGLGFACFNAHSAMRLLTL